MISGEMKISEIIEKYSYIKKIFLLNGFVFTSSKELIDIVGKDTMLKTILKVRNINSNIFIDNLNKIIEENEEEEYFINNYSEVDILDLYGSTICPIRLTLEDKIREFEKKEEGKQGKIEKYIWISKKKKGIFVMKSGIALILIFFQEYFYLKK